MEYSGQVRRVQRVRHELRQRDGEVVRLEALGSEFVRVTFAGDALADFVSLGFDDHVKVILADARGDRIRRDYTPRRFDGERCELTIDFALHGDGFASSWARQAAVGQRAAFGGPRGSMIVPTDYDWHLLAGDATAVPAISRRLEELPPDAHAIVVVQLSDDTPLQDLRNAARVETRRVATGDDLVAAIGELSLPAGEGYAWCAGEASMMARLRAIMVSNGHPREAMRVASYWKRGASDYHDETRR